MERKKKRYEQQMEEENKKRRRKKDKNRRTQESKTDKLMKNKTERKEKVEYQNTGLSLKFRQKWRTNGGRKITKENVKNGRHIKEHRKLEKNRNK